MKFIPHEGSSGMKQIHIHVDDKFYAVLKEKSKSHKLSVSEFVRQSVIYAIENLEGKEG